MYSLKQKARTNLVKLFAAYYSIVQYTFRHTYCNLLHNCPPYTLSSNKNKSEVSTTEMTISPRT